MVTAQEARTQLQQRRQQVRQTREALSKRLKALPERQTQMALRSRLPGLGGRESRRKVASAEQEILRRQEQVKEFETSLGEAERKIEQFETRQAEIKSQQEALKVAKKLAPKNIPLNLIQAGEVREFVREIRSESQAFEERQSKLVSDSGFLEKELSKLTERGLSEEQALRKLGLKISEIDDVAVDISKMDDRTLKAQTLPGVTQKQEVEPEINGTRGITSLFFERPEAPRETFDPRLGAFVSASEPSGQATAIVRLPTPEETRVIERAERRGGALSIPAEDIIKQARKFEELTKGLSELEGVNLTARVKELEKIGAKVETINTTLGQQTQIKSPSVKIFIGDSEIEVPIERLDTRTEATVVSSAIGITARTGIEDLSRTIGVPETGLLSIPERQEIVFQPLFGTIQTDPLTGEQITQREVEITLPEQRFITPSQIGGITEFSSRLLTFAPELVGSTREIVGRQEATLGGLGRGIVEVATTFPIETASIVLPGVLSAGGKLVRGLKLTRGGKFLTVPELKVVQLESEKIIENVVKEARIRPRVGISITEETININIKPKTKGKITQKELIPSEELLGKVTEVRDTGRRRISYEKGDTFLKSGIRIDPVLKEFKGTARLTPEGVFTEVINLDKGLKRVTTIGKDGKGTIRLLDKEGKLISVENINARSTAVIKETQVKEEKILVDEQFNQPLSLTNIQVRKEGKRLEKQKIVDREGNIIISDNPLDLRATLIKGEVKTRATTGINRETGEIRLLEDVSGFSEVITSGERKAISQVKKGDVNLIIRKRQGQTIEFGADKELDKALRQRIRGQERVRREISPNVDRELIEGAETRVTLGFINPRGKLRKILEKPSTSKQKIKELEKLIKENNKRGFKADVQRIKDQIKTLKEDTAQLLKRKPKVEGEQITEGALPSVTFVQPTEEILVGRAPPPTPPLPSLAVTTQPPISLARLSIVTLGARQQPTQSQEFSLLEVGVQRQVAILPSVDQAPVQLQVQQPSQLDISQPRLGELALEQVRALDRVVEQTRQRELLRQQARQLLTLEQAPITRQEERLRQEERVRQRPTEILAPTRAIVPIGEARQELIEAAKGIKDFEVFARTQGEDLSIGKASTQQEAVKLLRKELKGTIKASGFIEKEGERIPFRNLGIFNGEFRQSKLDTFRVVQVKTARLGTASEVEEIQLFGKAKGGALFRNPKNRGNLF